jgi:hypothetical protein
MGQLADAIDEKRSVEVTMTVRKGPTSRQGQRGSASTASTADAARTVVENVMHPGKSRTVDTRKYRAMRRAILKVLPPRAPGLTLADTATAVLPHLPASLFPGGARAGWWLKTVQLDLEAKRVIAREKTTPLRLHRS